MEFTIEQARNLLGVFGGSESQVTVVEKDGKLLAYHTEYPEEGSVEL